MLFNMETQTGWHVHPNDFRSGFEKIDDLVYYDGPLLSHYTTPDGDRHFLFKWLDYDALHQRWLVLEVTLEHLYDYLTNARTLHSILAQEYNRSVFVADADSAGDFEQVKLVDRTALPANYRPTVDSYYGLEPSEEYLAFFEEEAQREVPFARYLAGQRMHPVRLRLVPADLGHATTVGAADIAGFLQRITRSFRGYVEVRFQALFQTLYALEEQATKALSQLLEEASPRAVNAGFGSFEIDLALDVLKLEGLPADMVNWQRQALLEYEEDVLKFDFSADAPLPVRLRDANDEQLRAIFGPVVQIANNGNYVAQSRSDVDKPYQALRNVPPLQAQRVVPPRPRPASSDEADTEFANVLLQLQRGQDIDRLTVRQLRQSLISFTTSDESVVTVLDFVTSEGEIVALHPPIEVTLSKSGSFTEARYEPLGFAELGTSAAAVLGAVNGHLAQLYARHLVQDRTNIPETPSTSQQRISANFAQLMRAS